MYTKQNLIKTILFLISSLFTKTSCYPNFLVGKDFTDNALKLNTILHLQDQTSISADNEFNSIALIAVIILIAVFIRLSFCPKLFFCKKKPKSIEEELKAPSWI